MNEIYRLENITLQYRKQHDALTQIHLSVGKGEILSVIGSNGSGKSSLLHLMNGLIFPDKGTVHFKNERIDQETLGKKSFNQWFRQQVGYVFQDPDSQLFCPTVFDELIFGPLQMGMEKEAAYARAEEVMKMLHIDCLYDRPSFMISGGEKKRVAIGSILTMNPEVLLLDEPMSGLDPKTRSYVTELIFQLNEAGKTIIITTHHLELVDHLKSEVVVLSEQHRVMKSGSAEEILTDTDLLVRANLIYEQPHQHGDHRHRHLPVGFFPHRHDQS